MTDTTASYPSLVTQFSSEKLPKDNLRKQLKEVFLQAPFEELRDFFNRHTSLSYQMGQFGDKELSVLSEDAWVRMQEQPNNTRPINQFYWSFVHGALDSEQPEFLSDLLKEHLFKRHDLLERMAWAIGLRERNWPLVASVIDVVLDHPSVETKIVHMEYHLLKCEYVYLKRDYEWELNHRQTLCGIEALTHVISHLRLNLAEAHERLVEMALHVPRTLDMVYAFARSGIYPPHSFKNFDQLTQHLQARADKKAIMREVSFPEHPPKHFKI